MAPRKLPNLQKSLRDSTKVVKIEDEDMEKMFKGLRRLINELEQIEKSQVEAIKSA